MRLLISPDHRRAAGNGPLIGVRSGAGRKRGKYMNSRAGTDGPILMVTYAWAGTGQGPRRKARRNSC
ncbi:hypothetical protein HMPREF0322_04620 [Desulfitobacterium hafniense DP7]|uniref:Uncharacterized protein n=1 Tax=Desulfitobacterium hafniense DP7 TaxID=537010 RepID=G9XUG1_DESHA|nr:hypothetical protein HMPREF0322_04620 [Desulfitobacterium hafniense DP7]